MDETGEFIRHDACEKCGSKDNLAVYSDHTFCFGCKDHNFTTDDKFDDGKEKEIKKNTDLLYGEYKAISKRKFTAEDCRKFDYKVGKDWSGNPVQIATYRDKNGVPICQKLRGANKKFSVIGKTEGVALYGSHLWKSGKKLTICEGEVDTISASICNGNHKWPVVGIPFGTASAKKSLLENWDYLMNFQEIVLLFDNDKAGIEAARECAEALPLGRVKIASTLPLNDVNECLVAGNKKAVIEAIWQAETYRPDGIISSNDLREVIGISDAVSSTKYPYEKLNEITGGIFPSTMVLLTAGSGVGKSTLIRELAYHLHFKEKKTVGLLMLEETNKRSLQGLVGIHLEKNITIDPDAATKGEIETGFDEVFKERPIYLFDHWGSTALDTIVNRIQYMVLALGCTHIFLDHVSILVADSYSLTQGGSDERRLIDLIVSALRTQIVQELNVTLFVVSHLRRPSTGGGHESGSKVHLSELRGSHSLAQMSDTVLSLSVDSEDPSNNMREISVLKNRHNGQVKSAGFLNYSMKTGRLMECDKDFTPEVGSPRF